MLLRKILALQFIAVLIFVCVPSAHAAMNGTIQWEIRTTGNDTNGGCFDPYVTSPGTDYSQQDSPQITYTDLVIGGTTTQLTSAGNPFTSAAVGNCIHITSGTGFTTGWYEVMSVSGATATMDRSVGTAASSGGNGKLGGGLLTPGGWSTAWNNNTTSTDQGNIVWIKSGTYTLTSTWNIPGPTGSSSINFIGYNSTHGDFSSTRPLITTATNSTTLIGLPAGYYRFQNINYSNTATTKFRGFYASGAANLFVSYGTLTNFASPFFGDFNVGSVFSNLRISNVEVNGGSTSGQIVANWTSNVNIEDSYFHGASVPAIFSDNGANNGSLVVQNTIFAPASSTCINQTTSGSRYLILSLRNVVCYGATGAGITFANTTALQEVTMENVVVYGSSTYGIVGAVTASQSPLMNAGTGNFKNNAFGNNTSGATSGWYTMQGTITLTATPFTNAASGDFSLNATAGGGALLKATGNPGAFPGGTTTGYLDVGAAQSQSTTSTVSNYGFVQ